jgi:hypothetical protein
MSVTRMNGVSQGYRGFPAASPMPGAAGSGTDMMARVTGLEPATSDVTGRRSNQLSYTRAVKKRVKRPLWSVKQGRLEMAKGMGGEGIEPPTLSV